MPLAPLALMKRMKPSDVLKISSQQKLNFSFNVDWDLVRKYFSRGF